MADVDKAYVAMLRRKRAYFAESGNVAKANEMSFLLGQVGYAGDEPDGPETAKARSYVAPSPKGRQAPPKDKA